MNIGDFKTYVKLDFKRTDKDAEILQAHNDMVNWISLQMPHGAYKYQSYVNTTTEVEDYPLPSTLIHLIKPIRILDGSGNNDFGYPLDDLTKEEYDIREPNPNRTSPANLSKPSACCIYSRSILLTPIPDASTYILEINWTKRRTVLTGDTESPALGSEWDEVIKWGVLERLYAGMGMLDDATYWGSKYHAIVGGDDLPVGVCRKLFEIEKNIEGNDIGQIQANDL